MYFDKLQVGSKLANKGVGKHCSNAIVVLINSSSDIYEICTDYGEILTLNKDELNFYYYNEIFYSKGSQEPVEDLKERWLIQFDNLRNNLRTYCK